ncbi:MAG: L,D-transpeptidase [Aeromicrobium sp.]
MRGTVWTVLAVGALVAGIGGMFAGPAATSAVPSTKPVAAVHDTRVVASPKLPPASGTGRRIVFDQSDQRVWLVSSSGKVTRSYLVTGSNRGNVRPGVYSVKSKTRFARTYGGGGTLEYFVKFTQGHTAAIGFHAVTRRTNGTLVYARQDLGAAHTPGCVEAMRNDAAALWNFAPVGTPVVVTT